MKVLHVLKITAISGSENHLLSLLPLLADRCVDIVVVVMIEPGKPVRDFSERLEKHGIKVLPVKIGLDLSLPALLKITRIMKREQPDIVHTHLIHGDLYGILSARIAGIREIFSTKHNEDRFRKNFILQTLNRCLNSQARKIIAISPALKEFCIQYEKIDPQKIVVIPYGLEGYDKTLKDRRLRQRLGYGKEQIVFGIVARLTEQKGHTYLLQAFREVVDESDNVRLLIAGDGTLRGKLEALTRKLGLESYVDFLGRRGCTADIYNALDVFIHPSLWEGFGLVFLEAMSFALPIIATRVSAIPDIIRNGETGILVPAKNIPELAEAMKWMILHPDERKEMGKSGKQKLQDSFGVETMVERTYEIYQEIYREK